MIELRVTRSKHSKKLIIFCKKLSHIHSKKLFNFCLEFSKVSHDPDKIIFNYSSCISSKSETSLLCKGLNIAIPPDKLEYSDYLLPFELLYRDIKNLDLPNEKTNFSKAKIKDCALSSFKLYNEKGVASSLNKDKILFWKHCLKIRIWLYKSQIRLIQ